MRRLKVSAPYRRRKDMQVTTGRLNPTDGKPTTATDLNGQLSYTLTSTLTPATKISLEAAKDNMVITENQMITKVKTKKDLGVK